VRSAQVLAEGLLSLPPEEVELAYLGEQLNVLIYQT
jgi:hypothetical protein